MLQTFNVPAGGRQIDAKATFFRYESSGLSSIDESVRVRADGNDLGSYLPGDSIELPAAAGRWEVTPASATQPCIVRLGLGRVETARLVGTVSVIDQSSAKTSAGNQYLQSGGANAFAGVGSALYVGAAVAGSTRGIIKGISLQSSLAGRVTLYHAASVNSAPLPAATLASKMIGGAVATSLRIGGVSTAAAAPTAAEFTGITAFCNVYLPANQITPVPITTPFVLQNGPRLLIVSAEALNRDISWILDAEEGT